MLDIEVLVRGMRLVAAAGSQAEAEAANQVETTPFDGVELAAQATGLPTDTSRAALFGGLLSLPVAVAVTRRGALLVNAVGAVALVVAPGRVVQPAGRVYALTDTTPDRWVSAWWPGGVTVTISTENHAVPAAPLGILQLPDVVPTSGETDTPVAADTNADTVLGAAGAGFLPVTVNPTVDGASDNTHPVSGASTLTVTATRAASGQVAGASTFTVTVTRMAAGTTARAGTSTAPAVTATATAGAGNSTTSTSTATAVTGTVVAAGLSPRTAGSTPTATTVTRPAGGASNRDVASTGLAVTATRMGGGTATKAGASTPLAVTATRTAAMAEAPMTRPTGPGIYAIEDLGIGNWATMDAVAAINAATAAVAGRAAAPNGTRTLTLPEHTFTANGFTQSSTYLGFLIPAPVGIVGSGSRTIFEVAQDTMSQYTSDTYERYGAAPGSVNLIYVLLTQNAPTGTRYGQFHIRGTRQRIGGVGRDHYYGGWHLQNNTNASTVTDVKVSGIPGYWNSPPGETFGINLHGSVGTVLTRVEVDGRNTSGVAVGACGIGGNSASTIELHDCYTHHQGYSHGLALWQCRNVTTWNHRSDHNGTLGNPGTVGDGLNMERTFGTIHYAPVLGYNTLCEVRYFAENRGDAYDGQTSPHRIDNLTLTDGGLLDIHMDGIQDTVYPTLNNCPSPVYTFG